VENAGKATKVTVAVPDTTRRRWAGAPRRSADGALGWGGLGRRDESLGGCWAGASDGRALRSLAAGGVGGQGHDPQSDDDVEQDGVDGHDLLSSDLKGRPLRG
jgi:hypothetical protein